ncbi:hypothetical protein EG829_29395, partial [bacterium]|nr:hypothetical protein [bacterium]
MPDARLGSEYSACLYAEGGNPWSGTIAPGRKRSVDGTPTRYWEYSPETLLKAAALDMIDFKIKEGSIPAIKVHQPTTPFKPQNIGTLWLGGAVGKAEASRVGYSQDAKEELRALGLPTRLIGAKPSTLVLRLLALFSSKDDFILDIGSPTAEMASVATAAGRRAVYLRLPGTLDGSVDTAMRRLEKASRGEHPVPPGAVFSSAPPAKRDRGYCLDGAPRPRDGSRSIWRLELGERAASLDRQNNVLTFQYESYPAGTARFLLALASLEGLLPVSNAPNGVFAKSLDDRILAIYLGPEAYLDRLFLDRAAEGLSGSLGPFQVIRCYYHRGIPSSRFEFQQNIEVRRVPFELGLLAGRQ